MSHYEIRKSKDAPRVVKLTLLRLVAAVEAELVVGAVLKCLLSVIPKVSRKFLTQDFHVGRED